MRILLAALEFQRNSVGVFAEGPNMDLLAGVPGAGKHPIHPSTITASKRCPFLHNPVCGPSNDPDTDYAGYS